MFVVESFLRDISTVKRCIGPISQKTENKKTENGVPLHC